MIKMVTTKNMSKVSRELIGKRIELTKKVQKSFKVKVGDTGIVSDVYIPRIDEEYQENPCLSVKWDNGGWLLPVEGFEEWRVI